jgi:hypothetical protein
MGVIRITEVGFTLTLLIVVLELEQAAYPYQPDVAPDPVLLSPGIGATL